MTTTEVVSVETDVLLEDTGRSFEPTTLAEIEEAHVTLVEIDVPPELGLQPVCPE